MYYILIKFLDSNIQAYQELFNGLVMRITDMNGNTLSMTGSNAVINGNPPQPTWALPDPVISSPVIPKLLNRLEFRNLFTQAEKVAIYTAANTNVEIKVWLDDLAVADQIDLNDAQTISSVTQLETAGLIAAGRANQILMG